MDPGSAIGLALGAASLAVQVFDGAIKGFNIFEHAVNADRDCETFKVGLRIAYDKLVKWGETSGLLSDGDNADALYNQQIKSNGPLVVAILSQLEVILKDLRKTQLDWVWLTDSKSKSPSHPASGNVGHSEVTGRSGDITEPVRSYPDAANSSSDDMDLLKPHGNAEQMLAFKAVLAVQDMPAEVSKYPRGLSRLEKLAAGARVVMKQPKRFQWAVRNGPKFQSSLTTIHRLVHSLEEMLSHDQMAILVKSANDFKLDLLQLATNVEQMKALLETGQTSLAGTTLSEAQTVAGSMSEQPQSSEERFAGFLNAAIKFSIDMTKPPVGASGGLELGQSDIDDLGPIQSPAGDIRTYVQTKSQVYKWIEWKSYTTYGATRLPSADTTERVRRLVSLLRSEKKPSEFCVPSCMGFFLDAKNKRFGLVFDAHGMDQLAWPPSSLHSCYRMTGILLETRIRLAQQLSEWLLYLHAVNWLHKGIRSASILFSVREGSKEMSRPYVSGFEYARVSHQGDHTSTAPPGDTERAWYTHPKYLGTHRNDRFRKTYDIYSLGIILIELAYWKPIRDVYIESSRSHQPNGPIPNGTLRPASPSSRASQSVPINEIMLMRERMLSSEIDILDRIRENIGTRYYTATRACILGMEAFELPEDEDQTNPSIGAHIQRAFVEQVVDCLKGIVV